MQLRPVIVAGVLASLLFGCQAPIREIVEQTHPNGGKKKVSYFQGQRRNIVKTFFYFEDGKLQSEQYFKKGQPDSIQAIYFPSGKKYKETWFALGKRNGDERSWYENGQLKSEAHYTNDMPEGKVVNYYEDGKLSAEAVFKNGKKEGEDISYFASGAKKFLKTFVAGTATGPEKEWFDNGNLKMEQTWDKEVLERSLRHVLQERQKRGGRNVQGRRLRRQALHVQRKRPKGLRGHF